MALYKCDYDAIERCYRRVLLGILVCSGCALVYRFSTPNPSQSTMHSASSSPGSISSRSDPSSPVVRKVLILAYFRSGSTLTGQIFNYNPRAFFWYEPLAAVAEPWGWGNGHLMAHNYYSHDDGSEKKISDKQRTALVGTVKAILSCDFNSANSQLFVHRFMTLGWTKSLMFSTQPFRDCMDDHRKNARKIPICLPLLIAKCRRSNPVAAKVIRLHMSYTEQLLESDPDFRLVHLVRDPRGMIESWRKAALRKKLSLETLMVILKVMCRRMLADTVIRKDLERRFPGRIMLLRYEDLTAEPDRVVKTIYDGLLGLPVPGEVSGVLRNHLHANTSKEKLMGTFRKNGVETAIQWRHSIDNALVNYARNVCQPLITALNYDMY